MTIVAGRPSDARQRPMGERHYNMMQRAKAVEQEPDEPELTPEEQAQYEILDYCSQLYDSARKAREPFDTFDTAWDLFIGNVWLKNWPGWRGRITINKVRSFITFMQAIMTDNKPRLSVEPRIPGSEDAADLLRRLVDRYWDENDMQQKVSLFVMFGLIWGTGFLKVIYDPYADSGRGKHYAIPVVPYRIYTNKTATCVEDSEFLIHVEEQTMGWVRRNFPDKAKLVAKVRGVRVGEHKERNRDYVREGDNNETTRIISAQNLGNGNITPPLYSAPNPQYTDQDSDTVEIAEFWLRDDSLEGYQRPKYVNGKPQMKPVVGADGLYEMEIIGVKTAVSEIDGAPFSVPIRPVKMQPVMEEAWRIKYPNGRLVIVAGGRVLLRDVPNPYQTSGFPFAMWKDYDTGTFWGQGEPLALKDCQLATNRIASQLYDILQKIGNPILLIKKGGGVNKDKMKNKPGLLIPVDDMDAIKPLDKPAIPREFFELFNIVAKSMAEISGVNDAVMGAMPASGSAFATVDQLQEAGAAPMRLKVRNLESGLTRAGKLIIELIQQWDNGERPVRVSSDEVDESIVQPASEVRAQFRSYKKADLQGQVEFGVVPISSLSTSPAGTWNRFMTLYDKHLIDEIWWHRNFRINGWRTELPRMLAARKAEGERDAALKAASKAKPGPAPRTNSGREQIRRRQAGASPSQVPSAVENAAVR